MNNPDETCTSLEDGVCYYCGKNTNSIAGNPSEWPLMFCHVDQPGVAQYHHISCVTKRLDLLLHLQKQLPREFVVKTDNLLDADIDTAIIDYLQKVIEELKAADRLKNIHKMQAELLYHDVAFWGSNFKNNNINEEFIGIQFCVVCNDVFAWATADCELVEDKELPLVYNIFNQYGRIGIEAWCSLKRDKLEPQQPYLEEHLNFHQIRDQVEAMMKVKWTL